MQNLFFKKKYEKGIFNYLSILKHSAVDLASEENTSILHKYHFHYYTALAEYLTSHLDKYIILRYSPYLSKLTFLDEIGATDWKYTLLANDELGLGIDEGFLSPKDISDGTCQLYTCSKLLLLTSLPEDTFGDLDSMVTIFGLKNNRRKDLISFLYSSEKPILSDFLQKTEVFVHILISKMDRGYNSVLVKSVDDIAQELFLFQTILDPNN